MSTKVAIILGSGARIGSKSAALFAANGYKVVVANRSGKDAEGYTHLPLDLAQPASIEPAFAKVAAEIGKPSVVIYNGASPLARTDRALHSLAAHASFTNNPLSFSVDEVATSLTINVTSVYAAAQAAFKHRAEELTFLYTGNALNDTIWPNALTLVIGKSASAPLIDILARSFEKEHAKCDCQSGYGHE